MAFQTKKTLKWEGVNVEHFNLNQEKLKEIANASETAITTMMVLGSRQRGRSETILNRIKEQVMEMNKDISDKDYYDFWKGLEKAGVGALIVGRRGKQTRFAWNYSLQDVAKLAIGQHSKEPAVVKRGRGRPKKVILPDTFVGIAQMGDINQSFVEKQERIIIKIQVRPDYMMEINLPGDVSKEELKKLGQSLAQTVL